jgi:hypothetical protein
MFRRGKPTIIQGSRNHDRVQGVIRQKHLAYFCKQCE